MKISHIGQNRSQLNPFTGLIDSAVHTVGQTPFHVNLVKE